MADVSISLDLDARQLATELETAATKLHQFAGQTTQAGEKAGQGFAGGFKGNLGSLGTNITQALGAIGLGSQIKEVVEYGAHIKDLSDRFGVSTTVLQKFGNAAELNGSSLEGVAKGFRFLEVNQAKALGGNKAMEKSFADLGISLEDLATQRPDEIMLRLGDSGLNAANVVKVLGRSAAELRPVLGGLRDGTIQFGGAIDEIDIGKLKEADDAFKKLHQTITISLGTVIGSFFSNFQASISELVGKVLAAIEEIKGAGAAAERLVHGDISGAKAALATGHENAQEQVKQANKDAEEYRHPTQEVARRDFGLPPGVTEAGETDDEGRATGKATDKGGKGKKKDESDIARIRELSRPKTNFEEAEKLTEKHAEETERAIKQDTREREKAEREAKRETRRLGAPDRPTTPEERDEADRRAHGSYIGPGGGVNSGLVTGHVQGASLAGSAADFNERFHGTGRHLDIAAKVKESSNALGKDPEKHLPVAEKQLTTLEKIEKNTADLGKNKS